MFVFPILMSNQLGDLSAPQRPAPTSLGKCHNGQIVSRRLFSLQELLDQANGCGLLFLRLGG